MLILLTNDDGVYAPGLRAMRAELKKLGQVVVVAPAAEQSAAGHSITLLTPLLVQEVLDADNQPMGWAVEGRPADCVKLALIELLPGPPDLIVSGLNAGSNAGINVLYSGTVAAAIEGAFFGITSIAISLEYKKPPKLNFPKAAVLGRQMVEQILAGHASIGNDFPISPSYALYPEGIEQRAYDPEQAAFHYKKSGHSGPVLLRTSEVAFPGAVDAAQLYQQQAQAAGIEIQVQREPGDGYWTEVWNAQPFCASYWGGRPTQDSMYSTAYITGADWNDTRFFDEGFDTLIRTARAELDDAKRGEMYREAATKVRDDGGLILPMFNDFLDARREEVQGWVQDPNHETSNLRAATRVWLDQA